MRNKKLRNTLLALALTPFFALSATACTLNNNLSEEKQSEAYSTLRNILLTDNLLTDSGSNAVRTQGNITYTFTTDWSNSAIPEDKREEIATSLDIPLENSTEEENLFTEYGYSYLNNTGYYYLKSNEYDKDENNNRLETNSYRISEMNFVNKVNNNYLKYGYTYNVDGKDNKSICRVDDKYAVNSYRTQALDDIKNGIKPLLRHIGANESLTSFKEVLAPLGKDIIYYVGGISITDDFASIEPTTSVNIKLTNGRYSLKTNFAVEDYKLDGVSVDMSSKSIIKYKNNSIENIDFEFKLSYNMNINCKEELSSDFPDIPFNDENNITSISALESKASIDFKNSFDNTICSQDVSEHTGTGTNGTIENNKISLNFIYVNFKDCNSISYNAFKFNDLLTLTQNNASLFSSEHITKSYYWDKECTQPVLDYSTVPSYDTDIYVKLIVDDGYAVILEQSVDLNGDRDKNFSSVYDINSGKYTPHITSSLETLKVTVNDEEITNYLDGITFTEGGFYQIDIYVKS